MCLLARLPAVVNGTTARARLVQRRTLSCLWLLRPALSAVAPGAEGASVAAQKPHEIPAGKDSMPQCSLVLELRGVAVAKAPEGVTLALCS
jgi:hypothetical protein